MIHPLLQPVYDEAVQAAIAAAALDATDKDALAMTTAKDAAVAQQIANVREGRMPASPRLRTQQGPDLNLSTSWQRIQWTGTSAFNVNLFRTENSQQVVRYDSATHLFRFSEADKNVDFAFDFTVNGGLRPIDVFLRFYVPKPGAPYGFPNPEGTQSTKVFSSERLVVESYQYGRPVYITNDLVQYGLAIEVRSSQNPLLQTVTLEKCICLITAY